MDFDPGKHISALIPECFDDGTGHSTERGDAEDAGGPGDRGAVYCGKADRGADQAAAAEEVDGSGGAGQAYGAFGQFSVAAGDGARGADARNLARIAMVFSKDLSYFFESGADRRCSACTGARSGCGCRRRGWSRRPIFLRAWGTWCRTGTWIRTLRSLFRWREPQEPKAHMHPGFEFLYVLDGELTIQHGENRACWRAGDAVYFDSATRALVCVPWAQGGERADCGDAPAAGSGCAGAERVSAGAATGADGEPGRAAIEARDRGIKGSRDRETKGPRAVGGGCRGAYVALLR